MDRATLQPLKIVVNAGNGGAGHVIDGLEPSCRSRSSSSSTSRTAPSRTACRTRCCRRTAAITSEAVRAHGADLGVAWDGDFDRCFLFDERGEFIEGYYIVGLLAQVFLQRQPGQPDHPRPAPHLEHDRRRAPARRRSGAEQDRSRLHQGAQCAPRTRVYGGEMSAHHYFRDFAYCDSGMIPWLLVAQILCDTGKPLSPLVAERIAAFPASGEINRRWRIPRRPSRRCGRSTRRPRCPWTRRTA